MEDLNLTLVGRDEHVRVLQECYRQSSSSQSQLVWVGGVGGSGKSTLVRRTLAEKKFCRGKFDRLKPAHVFPVLVSLLEDVGSYLRKGQQSTDLMAPEEAALLCKLVPGLQRVLGGTNETNSKIDQQQQQQQKEKFMHEKLKQAIISFLASSAQLLAQEQEEALVLFLDDCQWIDEDTLGILQAIVEALLAGKIPNTMLIGAYRDNEIAKDSHMARCILQSVSRAVDPTQVSRITVGDLSLPETHALVAQVLGFSANDDTTSCTFRPLTDRIFQKTLGNTLFTLYLMRHLYDRNILRHGDESGWMCDLERVQRELDRSDDVAEFLVLKLNSIPASALNVLQIAACIGGQVRVELLQSVVEQQQRGRQDKSNHDNLQSLLQVAWKEQLILFMEPDRSSFMFAHDRIQSAAYSMVPDQAKQALHLMIGQCLHESLMGDKDGDMNNHNTDQQRQARSLHLVVAADQLQRGRQFIEQVGREKLVELNLQASQILVETGAFNVAETFLENGIEVLSLRKWDEYYELSLELHSFLAWVQFANGRMKESLSTIRDIYLYAKSIEDQYEARYIHVQVLASSNRLDECLDKSNQFLKDLGHARLPKNAGLIHIIPNMIRVDVMLQGKTDQELLKLPLCQDPQKMATLCHLAFLMHVAFFSGRDMLIPVITCRVMQISLQHGFSVHTPYSFASYAFSQTVTGDWDQAERFAKLALALTKRSNTKDPQTSFMVYGLLQHMRQPIHSTIAPTLAVYREACGMGDLSTAGQAANLYMWQQMLSGLPLGPIIDENLTFIDQMGQSNQVMMHRSQLTLLNYLLELTGRSDEMARHMGLAGGGIKTKLSDEQFEDYLRELPAKILLFGHWILKLMVRFYLGDQKSALHYAEQCWRSNALQGALCYCVPYYLFSALTALDHWRERPYRRIKYWSTFQRFRRELKVWVKRGNVNCEHLALLLKAECQSARGKVSAKKLAITYQESIVMALERGFPHDAALAHERAAKHMLATGDIADARDHLRNALTLYEQWGATAKVQQLQSAFFGHHGAGDDETIFTLSSSSTAVKIHQIGVIPYSTMVAPDHHHHHEQ